MPETVTYRGGPLKHPKDEEEDVKDADDKPKASPRATKGLRDDIEEEREPKHNVDQNKDVIEVLKQPLAIHGPEAQQTEIKVTLEHSKRFVFSQNEILPVKTIDHEPYEGLHFKEHKTLLAGPATVMMCDKEGHPIALCIKESHQPAITFTICGTMPLVDGDSPVMTEGDFKFYRWYQVRDDTVALYRPILVWHGENFKTAFRAVPATNAMHEHNNFVIEHEPSSTKIAHMKKENMSRVAKQGLYDIWEITIYPGFNPVAVLCFVASIDYMVPRNYFA